MQEAKSPSDFNDLYYFSGRLRARLNRIPAYPVTVLEAPSGFGKTTAIREYLRERRPEGVHENWYTCLGEPSSKSWEGICRLFGGIDTDVSVRLKELGVPTMETIADTVSVLREPKRTEDAFLILDNYQLFKTGIPREIIRAFAMHAIEGLHVIFLTQTLAEPRQAACGDSNVHYMGAEELFFDGDSIAKYFALSGVEIPKENLSVVQDSAGGWIAAIRLQLMNYRESGAFIQTGGMDHLIETAMWNRLSLANKNFLISVSLLESFTLRQVAIMMGRPSVPQSIEYLLKMNAFISWSESQEAYYVHTLLKEYLMKRFDSAPDDFRQEALQRAALAYEAVGDYYKAAVRYCEIKDYEAALSLPFTTSYMNSEKDAGIVDFIARLVDECPGGILRRYPFIVLAFAFQFMISGKYDAYGRLMQLIEELIKHPGDLPGGVSWRLKGEMALLRSFMFYNDIERMSVCHREALECLNRSGESPRTVILGTTPWAFGVVSVLCLFWSRVGELEKELCLMDECMPCYMEITNGHGTGAAIVMRAEALLLRGEDAEAEILCYRALYLARNAEQNGICLCAELLLARIAVLRGDANAYETMIKNIAGYATEHPGKSIRRMVDQCAAHLALLTGKTDDIADWLRETDGIRRTLSVQGQPCCLMLLGRMLLLEGRRAELYGLARPALDAAAAKHYLLPQVYWRIYLAAADRRKGRYESAVENLTKALALALPDRVTLPFAEYADDLAPLLQKAGRSFDPYAIRELTDLCDRQAAGTERIKKHITSQTQSAALTSRETEIATLAARRFHITEIASELFISENTVKSALKSIYGKLNVHSRRELAKKVVK